MKRVLIFGVAGFVGSYLVEEFHKANIGYEVYGTDVVTQYKHAHMVQYVSCDILNEEKVQKLVQSVQPDYIVNLAALSSVGMSWNMPKKTMEVNVIGSMNIVEATIKLEKKPVILLVGSSEEYAMSEKPLTENSPLDASNPYGISKMALEKMAQVYCKKYGCKIYFTRSFNHTGSGQKDSFVVPSFCKQVAEIEKSGRQGIVKVGNLSARRDISDVRDVVKAYRMILESESPEKVFNVGSGNVISMREILDYIISLCSYPVEVEIDSDKVRPVDNPYICSDNTLLRTETGWESAYTVYDIIREMYGFYVASF